MSGDKNLVWWKSAENQFCPSYGMNSLDTIDVEDSWCESNDEFCVHCIARGRSNNHAIFYRRYIAPLDGYMVFTGEITNGGVMNILNITQCLSHQTSHYGIGYRETIMPCKKGDILDAYILLSEYTVDKDDYTRETYFKHLKIGFTDKDLSYSHYLDTDRKKILVIGDSTSGIHPKGSTWTDILTKNHNDIFAYNVSFSGASYCERSHRGFEPFTAQNIFDCLCNKNCHNLLWEENNLSRWFYKEPRENAVGCDIDKFDSIAFFLGSIDFYDGMPIYFEDCPENIVNTFSYKVHYLIETAIERFPTKEIIFISPYYNEQLNSDPLNTPNSAGYTLTDYVDCIRRVVNKFLHRNIRFINLLDDFDLNKQNLSRYTFDKIHLTYEGLEKLERTLYPLIK